MHKSHSHVFTAEEIVVLVETHKVPILIRHGVAAVFEGTKRIVKKNKNGKEIRTSKRINVSHRAVSMDKKGFIGAFNIIASQFHEYGYVNTTKDGIILTGKKGRPRNTLHLRETDNGIRSLRFMTYYYFLLKKEIENYRAAQNK